MKHCVARQGAVFKMRVLLSTGRFRAVSKLNFGFLTGAA